MSDRVVVVTERDTAELPCVAAGHPEPRISWIKDGRLSLDGDIESRYQLLQSGSLRINDIQVQLGPALVEYSSSSSNSTVVVVVVCLFVYYASLRRMRSLSVVCLSVRLSRA